MLRRSSQKGVTVMALTIGAFSLPLVYFAAANAQERALEGIAYRSPSVREPLEVLEPWTPVEATKKDGRVEVSVWGRRYSFASGPLPTEIHTQGRKLLCEPVKLLGIVNGKSVTWTQTGTFLFQQAGVEAILCGWQTSAELVVNATVRISFDGLMRIALVVAPQRRHRPKVERLWLELPLHSDLARLFHYWPGRWGSAENSGAVPAGALRLPFKPFLWVGWEGGGLSWMAESDRLWNPRDSTKQIELLPQGNCTTLRFHLLDSPPARLPLTYTFALQATPLKPWRPDWQRWHICHGAYFDMEKPHPSGSESVLERASRLGARTLVFHEHWTPIQNYFTALEEKKLKRLVAACHDRGMRLLLYFGYELSTLAPQWGSLAEDVLVKSPSGDLRGGYQRKPPQRAYIVCYNSVWQDRLLEGITAAVDRYGFDGVYLDGTIEPWGCCNRRHGCGYRDSGGRLHPTYPIFAVRRLMARLYAAIHKRRGLVNAHQSTCCVTATLAYVDSYWDGEQFGGGQLAGDPLKKLPLAAFRAEFTGRNFGVPCEFLVYERPPAWTDQHALAFTLLHDVPVRPLGFGKRLELASRVWAVMEKFGTYRAQWYPYWENENVVEVEPQEARVSFYLRRPEKTDSPVLLLVVSNLSPTQAAEVRVKLRTEKLGLRSGGLAARDALKGEPVRYKSATLIVPLEPMRMRLVLVGKATKRPQ